MNKVRFTISTLLLLIALIFTCDLYQIYIYSFEDFYNTSFYTQPEIETEDMLTDICRVSDKYDVQIFFIAKEIEGDFYTNVNVFCDMAVKEYLEKEYFIVEGTHKSLFSGSTSISYHEFMELDANNLKRNPDSFYLFGEREQVLGFKAELVDTYGGSLPKHEERDSRKDIQRDSALLWGVVISIILITTYYNVISAKKEYFIQLSLGERISHIVFKNILFDSLYYFICFVVFSAIIYFYSGGAFLFAYNLGAIMLLLILNALIYLDLFRFDLKRSISNEKMSQKLLGANYFLKFILTLLVSMSFASNLYFIAKYMELNSQKEFYESRSEYYYINFTQYHGEIYNLESFFYCLFYDEFDIQFDCALISYDDSNDLVICMNENMKDYLLTCIPSIKKELDGEESYLILPASKHLSDEEIDSLKTYSLWLSDREDDHVKMVIYDKTKINTRNILDGYEIAKNPIIIYSNRSNWDEFIPFEGCIPTLVLNEAFSKVDITRLEQFCDKNQCSYLLTNVYDDYSYLLDMVRRGSILNLILLIIQLLIEILLISTIVKLEFEANRLELVLKKIWGYTIWERISKLYRITIVSFVISLIIVFIAHYFGYLKYANFVNIGLTFLMIVECILTTVMFIKQEQDNIQRTLKGGYL